MKQRTYYNYLIHKYITKFKEILYRLNPFAAYRRYQWCKLARRLRNED